MRHEVWAPRASSAGLRIGDADFELAPDPDRPGWFADDLPGLAHGDRYDVVLDGDVVRPDPLARRLPDGVKAAAQVWDPAPAVWTDTSWRGRDLDAASVIYELHVGTFTAEGTLAAAAQRLGYLVDLGITHVELMPVAAFDGLHGWGYDGVAINAVHEPYGGPDGLCAFVDAAHGHGLAVLLDVVHNHLGPSGNSWHHFGPFVTDTHHTPWGGAVNLDAPGSDDVRAILLSSVAGWLRDYHLDGLRLDAVHELRDSRAFHFLQELSEAVQALAAEVGRPLLLIAESDRNDSRTVSPLAAHGLGMSAQWDDDVHHALHWLLTGETSGYYADFGSCEAVAHTLEQGFLHDRRWSSFRGRTHGAPVDWSQVTPSQFVVSQQTHDQVGNRALGERLSQLVDIDLLAAGAALLLSLPFTPMLFMGEEWGASTPWQFFSSFPDAALGEAVTEGRRTEFSGHGWNAEDVPDPQSADTLAASRLLWDERFEQPHAELLAWYGDLIRLRREQAARHLGQRTSPATSGVTCEWETGSDGRPSWFSVAHGGQITVVNFGEHTLTRPLHLDARSLLAWRDCADVTADGARVRLQPRGCAILGLEFPEL